MFINSVNDEASDTISFDQKTSSSNEDQDEEEKAAKHLVLTLKQVELLLSRLKYKTGEIPESIMKAKQEAYNKVRPDHLVGKQAAGHSEAVQLQDRECEEHQDGRPTVLPLLHRDVPPSDFLDRRKWGALQPQRLPLPAALSASKRCRAERPDAGDPQLQRPDSEQEQRFHIQQVHIARE